VDLGSRNGTLVNGERLTDRRSLSDGDRISVGNSQIKLALPRSQPTIAVEAPVLSQSPHASFTVAVEAPALASPTFPAHESVFVAPQTQPNFAPPVSASDVPKPVSASDVPKPATAIDFSSPASADYETPPHRYEVPPHADEPTHPVYSPPPVPGSYYALSQAQSYPQAAPGTAGTGSSGMGLVIGGAALIALCLGTYLAYIEPKMAEYQSVGGQLAGGLMSLFGNNSYYQQFQTLYYERIACIVGGFVGAGLVLVGVMKRR